jgi:dephospho-CoA kinase
LGDYEDNLSNWSSLLGLQEACSGMKNLIVGLTGGIACGKTTVARVFQTFGADVIDTDVMGHQLLKSDPAVYRQIVTAFGRRVLNDREEIDRPELGRIVFDNPVYLRALNKIVHPPLIRLIEGEIRQRMSAVESKIIVVDAPLLIEVDMTDTVDTVVVVYADEDVQVRRLMQRGLSEQDALKRIRSQMPSHEKARLADFVIETNGSLSDTARQARRVWEDLTSIYMEAT